MKLMSIVRAKRPKKYNTFIERLCARLSDTKLYLSYGVFWSLLKYWATHLS
jgi:hypothetical protein